jgi:hypothetical protein
MAPLLIALMMTGFEPGRTQRLMITRRGALPTAQPRLAAS